MNLRRGITANIAYDVISGVIMNSRLCKFVSAIHGCNESYGKKYITLHVFRDNVPAGEIVRSYDGATVPNYYYRGEISLGAVADAADNDKLVKPGHNCIKYVYMAGIDPCIKYAFIRWKQCSDDYNDYLTSSYKAFCKLERPTRFSCDSDASLELARRPVEKSQELL